MRNEHAALGCSYAPLVTDLSMNPKTRIFSMTHKERMNRKAKNGEIICVNSPAGICLQRQPLPAEC
jgi:hypothetical protein